jgi:hypothetical protein
MLIYREATCIAETGIRSASVRLQNGQFQKIAWGDRESRGER